MAAVISRRGGQRGDALGELAAFRRAFYECLPARRVLRGQLFDEFLTGVRMVPLFCVGPLSRIKTVPQRVVTLR